MTPPAHDATRTGYGPLCAGGGGFVLFLLLAGCAALPARVSRGQVPPGSVYRLVGATPTALEAELGRPLLLRHDGPAEVWLYRSSRCAIDLILYRDPATGAPRVASADTRPLGAPLSDAECLASLTALPNQPSGRVAGGSD
ncbi:MAG TPA: hypothetical protein VMF62_05305 [Acetobacteraceae bacterium]|nr:hypothetical protein [Acetobacteraceae bacterium]